MVKDVLKRFSTLALAALMVLTMLPVMAMAADLSVTTIDGLTASYTEGDYVSWSVSGNEITGDIHGNSGCSSVTAASSTLTLKNSRAAAATLSFEYEVTLNGGSVSINGNTCTTNGTFVIDQWNSGDSIDITITSVANVNTHTIIVIKNISLYDPAATANVKFLPSEGGTITVDGELISQESVKTNTADHEYSLVATPDDGFRFFGWFNSQNKKISSRANSVFHFDKDETVYAKFIDASSPVFEVDGEQFIDLNEASRYAVENTKSTIVLVEDGTLPAGEYSIPQGITLLIPFDADYTLYTDEPDYVKIVETQYAFRTLTIADGATVNVDGAISVSGKCFTSSSTSVCKPTGAYGHIKMLTGSVINVNNGATLYAWGYITGEGDVIAHSGAQLYEFFQIADWRGGTATSNFKDNANKVFPFSQYYVQNIEAPITYKKGASETVRITVTAGGVSASAEVTFVGEAGMFQLEEGSSVTKRYDPISDRLIFDIYGSAVLNGIAMENLPVIGSFNSNVYVLPINNNMTMNIHSGSMTLNQDTALLPGSEVVVDGGAELVIGDGVSLYIYDDGTWSTDYVWGSKNPGITQVAYSPSGRGSRGISDATVDVNGTVIVNGFVYTTGIGAKIVSSLGSGRWVQSNNCGTATVTYQASQDGSGNPKYYDIPITPAKLRNAGDTYFETSKIEAGTTVNYYKEYGAWHHHEIVAEIRNARAESCTEDGYSGDTYCKTCDMMIKYGYSIDAHHTLKYHDKAEPTCTATGMEEYWECTVCKSLYADEGCTKLVEKLDDLKIDAKGHTPGKAVKEDVVPATCEIAGSYDEVVYCQVCGNEVSRVSKILSALGHTPGEAKRENVVEPSCMVDGRYEEVVYCSVCNDEISRVTKKIEATGHTPVDVAEVPATCTEPGTAAGTKCGVCGDELSGFEVIPPAGHQWDEGKVITEPTCEGTGVKTFTCSNCQEKRYEDIPATGHQWDEGKVTTEPKCEEAGVKTYTCKVCNETKTEAIDAMGHTPVEVPEVPATCLGTGTTAGTKCSVCDTILSGVEEIPAKGHQWNDGEITTAPTCTEKGVKTYTCSVCKETKTEKIDKTNDHTPGEAQRENVKEATCTKDGSYDEVVRCKVCNKELSREPKTITSPGHQWDDGVVTTEPKCEEAGVKTYTCKVCKETKTEAIDATGHTPVEVPEVPATCTEPGKKAGTKCSVCNKILSGVEEIPAKGHTPGKAVKESVVLATCEAAGSYEEVVYCEVCKEKLTRVSKTLPAMGHTRGEAVRENVIDSTCADEGSCDEVVYCEVCKKELSREAKVIEKKAHTPVDVAEVPATCTEPGTTAGTKCDVCGTILSGVKEIPANGHTEVIRNAKPATDTEDGYTGDVYCEVCNELLRNGEVIPATHVKITWIINGVKHETVCAKGEIPVYDGETPAKPETSRFTYEFKGWDKEIVAATENAEYTAEFTAIGKNGLCIEGNDTFWIKNGVNIAFPGLIRIADENGHIHYYYFAEDGKAVKNGNYKVNKNNGLPLPEYGFAFESDGVIVHDEDTSKNGICDGDGSKFYYIDGVKVGEGLIKVGDYYYYARTSSGEIVRNRQYWITKTNELPIQQGIFDFDAEGRMIVTGFIHAFGATYYYDNGVLAKGFTKIGDDYYIFNASSGKMYSNATMWVPDNEYGITGGMYEFDADGKMIRTGFITTGGYTYYYDNGVLAKGFTKIGDDYYFFNAGSGKMYRDATLWVADNAEYGFVGGMYYFGADGKMVLPDIENGKKSIVTINGKKYLTIDGAYAPTGLYEIDGNCYYVKAAGELAVGETVWVDNKNGLIPAKGDWRAFDAEGKLIHTGFVTGGDGYVYHYTDDVLSLGFTCIDGEYYLFNAGSGKMYRDANMWVGPNDYGIVGGMYYFDANGKMAR